MGQSVFPAPAAGKTRYAVTLLSGTSWTVPAGVTYVNATLVGGGGGGAAGTTNNQGINGTGGQIVESNVATTPGASITYAIGAGGGGAGSPASSGGGGGNTTFTGATTALAGAGGVFGNGSTNAANAGLNASNNGLGKDQSNPGGNGGAGAIYLEYWL